MSHKLRNYSPAIVGTILIVIGLAIMIGIDYLAYQYIHENIDSVAISAFLAFLVGGFCTRLYFPVITATIRSLGKKKHPFPNQTPPNVHNP